MSFIKFNNIGIKGLAAVVPKQIIKTIEQTQYFDEKRLTDFVSTTGIQERRIAPKNICSSDMCLTAANNLFSSMNIDRNIIDAIIFVSQTPDYRQPATSIILQDKLNLKKDIYSIDINQACSGFIWGLITSFSLINAGFENILLLAGDTPSKFSSPNDSSTALMFGDGGIASLICKDIKYGESFFTFNTDGSAFNAVNIPGGGFRNMSSIDTLTYTKDSNGNEKTEEQIHMDGLDVFSYTISALTKDVKNILSYANMELSYIDKIVLHQANKYMNDLISKKLKIDPEKSLKTIHKYGNTSCISIPLTIADEKEKIDNNDLILCTSIGAGFTWGSAILRLADTFIVGVDEL